ncbi:MAG: hypothetical protein WA960_19575 [Tunicatimonas sp.]
MVKQKFGLEFIQNVVHAFAIILAGAEAGVHHRFIQIVGLAIVFLVTAHQCYEFVNLSYSTARPTGAAGAAG